MDDFESRFSAAKATRRDYIQDASREVYKFAFNGRETEWDDRQRSKDNEPEEIFTDAVATVAEEFFGELFSTMTPENSPWVEYEAGNAVSEENASGATEQLQAYEQAIAKSIRGSNYYDEGPTAFQDAVIGTVALWVDRPSFAAPLLFTAKPISRLFLRLGPKGIEDRFLREKYYLRDLPSLLPNATFSRDMMQKIKTSGGSATVVWGFWRDYSDPKNPVWKTDVRVDGKPVGLEEALGEEGACPLIVGRFNPRPGSPYGWGPGLRMLPTIRVLDEITRMNLEGMDRNLDPAYVYQHDGMLDLRNGIENGMGYPAMPGTRDAVQPIGLSGSLDYGFFSEERLLEAVRDGFYRDTTQRGKTPPSASQYMGEEQKQLRRIARPAAKLWREIGVGILKRVEYLERQPGGILESLKVPLIESGTIIARPISPLERAQAREDVLVAQSIMGIANEALGPQQAPLLIDGPKTISNIKNTLKDKIVTIRTEAQIQELLQQMQGPTNAPQ